MSVSFNLGVPPAATATKATTAAATKATTAAAPPAAHPAAPKAACKHGNKCHGCKVCGKGGKGGSAQVAQLSTSVETLRAELAGMKTASAATDARLNTVSAKVDKTNSNIDMMLAMMQEDRAKRVALPPPPPAPARPAIMPPSSTLRSQSPPIRMELVTSGPEGSFGQECGFWVPEWGSSKSSKSSSSTGPYSGQNGWADKVAAGVGGGAMVVAKSSSCSLPSPSSLTKILPSPSSLRAESGKKAVMSGSGLVRCSNPQAFFQALKSNGWTEMLQLLQSSNSSVHLLTAAVNAYSLSPTDEADAIAIAFFDRARPARAFEPRLYDTIRAAFDPENPAFKQFCLRMAEFCSKSPEKGIKYCDVTYPYAHLAQNDEHRKQLIAALRDN